jgi:hypothetical protein
MGLTNFPNGISSQGVPVSGNGIPATKGNVFFVDYGSGSDGNSGKSINKAFKTLSYAVSRCVTNNFDVICLVGSATHTLTEMLTISINRLTIVGLDGSMGRSYGQNAKVSLGVTTAATDIGTVKNTGVRNVFNNIKFINENTVAEGIYCFVDGGEYTQLVNFELYKSTDLDVTGAAELVANGDSSQYINGYIGSTVNAISGAIIRPCVTFSLGLAGAGKVARDVSFKNVTFARKCGNTANRFVYGAEATSIERLALFENCIFWNAALASAIPAQNVAFGSSLTDGSVLLRNCSSMKATTAMSTTTGVFVDGPVPAADTVGIALQAS